ncbi:asparaginase [Anaeromicropila populeti]|uniref:asparaginase n=1 Tax=Anaeromicropila populeti TaxID=37658 RepID=A0A1I6IXY4_9FIRM|nr:asparaginase [Anaeromicropila populeti]SFR71614.1 L-asparaginase [Anaeromicropila populeti]
MERILIIMTGGTISSIKKENILNVDDEVTLELLIDYRKRFGDSQKFDIVKLMNILSENFSPAKWEEVVEAVLQGIEKGYEGIIITHGSDTLSYTAAFLGTLFANVKVPIMLVAANYSLEDKRSNGFANFISAVHFIHQRLMTGVFVAYQNNRGENEIFPGVKIMESDPYFDQFRSIDGKALGCIKNGEFQPDLWCLKKWKAETEWNKENSLGNDLSKAFLYQNKVILLKMYPGIDFSMIQIRGNVKAVILWLYHSATGPIEKESGLLEFLLHCKEKRIVVYGVSFKHQDGAFYASTKKLIELSLKPLCNVSIETAYALVLVAYNQNLIEPERFIEQKLF